MEHGPPLVGAALLGERALVVLLLFPLGLIAFMRLILGKDLFRHILGNFIYDFLKWSFFQLWCILGVIFYSAIWLICRLRVR